jgi:hypothetical protein
VGGVEFVPIIILSSVINNNRLLTFGLGIIILQGVSRRKSLAGVNIMISVLKVSNVFLFSEAHTPTWTVTMRTVSSHVGWTLTLACQAMPMPDGKSVCISCVPLHRSGMKNLPYKKDD